MLWVYSPHLGGQKIPKNEYKEIRRLANSFALTRSWSYKFKLKLHFRGQFCYINAIEKKEDNYVFKLCRLRYFSKNRWSLGYYSYADEKYKPCIFSNGEDMGTLEEAIELCEDYLIE